MYKSEGMEIISAALELKPWLVGKNKEAVKHLENLWLSPLEPSRNFKEDLRHPKCCIPLHLALLHPFSLSSPHSCGRSTPPDLKWGTGVQEQPWSDTTHVGPLPVLLQISFSLHPSKTEVHVEALSWTTSAFLWLLQLLFLSWVHLSS